MTSAAAIPFLVALLVGVVATGVARWAAIRLGVLNHPNPINRDHVSATPYLGGLGIAAGVLAGLAAGALVLPKEAVPLGFVVGGIAFLAVGLLDDLYTFGAGRKIALQALAAVLAIAAGGVDRQLTGIPVVDGAFAFLWILGLCNAFNFIDVSDGLAASVAATVFAVIAIGIGVGYEPVLAAAAIGGCLAFLVWNRPPARIFMGDAGSLFLGFLLAGFVLTAAPGVAPWPFLAMLALFVAVPLFDMAFQTL